MFDSPTDYCPHCKEYVALDQSQGQCAAEQRCQIQLCPLQKYFEGEPRSIAVSRASSKSNSSGSGEVACSGASAPESQK